MTLESIFDDYTLELSAKMLDEINNYSLNYLNVLIISNVIAHHVIHNYSMQYILIDEIMRRSIISLTAVSCWEHNNNLSLQGEPIHLPPRPD